MKSILQTGAVMAAMLLGLAGCETTGDPNAGGIFWSPSKADARIAQKNVEFDEANRRLERSERESASLNRENKRLTSRIESTKAELAAMLREVRQIEQTGNPRFAQKASNLGAEIEQAQASVATTDEATVSALQGKVASLRNEWRQAR